MIKEVLLNIYDYDALKIAKNIVDKEDKIKLTKKGNKAIIESNDNLIIKKLHNEVLNQDLRIELLKKNKEVIRLIMIKALSSALNDKGGK